MACPPAVHLNHEKYKDPLEFNPWRWDVSKLPFIFIIDYSAQNLQNTKQDIHSDSSNI